MKKNRSCLQEFRVEADGVVLVEVRRSRVRERGAAAQSTHVETTQNSNNSHLGINQEQSSILHVGTQHPCEELTIHPSIRGPTTII